MMDDRNLDENDFFGNTILFFEKLMYDYKKMQTKNHKFNS